MPLSEVIRLVPGAFGPAAQEGIAMGASVTLQIEALYDQLGKGKVKSTVADIARGVDPRYLSPEAAAMGATEVSLPLHLVVGSVNAEELRGRTAQNDRMPELDDMPNLFDSVGKPIVHNAPAAAAPPPAPPAPQPVAQPAPPPPVAPPPPAAPVQPVAQAPAPPAPPPAAPVAPEPELPPLDPDAEFAQAINFEDPTSGSMGFDDVDAMFSSAIAPPPAAPAQPPPPQYAPAPAAPPPPAPPPATPDLAQWAAPPPAPAPAQAPAPAPVPHNIPAPFIPEPVSPDAWDLGLNDDVSTEGDDDLLDLSYLSFEDADDSDFDFDLDVADFPELDEASLPTSEESITDAVAQAVPDKVPVVNMRGVDLNRVTAQEIVRKVDKVGPKLAERIIQDRNQNGWYRDVYDLTRITGIGRRTFKTITGEEWDEDLCGPRQTIKKIMGSADLSNVKVLAERVGRLKAFEGCLVAHVDGYVLATSWDHPANEGLAAMSPQIFKKVEGYLMTLQLGNVDTFTFYMQKIPVTLANSGDIYVAAIHKPASFNQKHVSFVRALSKEVQRSFELQRQVSVG